MIIWINGAFGVGKTQTAGELHRRIPGSHIFDPEQVGYFLGRQFPRGTGRADFQDYPVWRMAVSGILEELQIDPDLVVIVPMTIVSADYYRDIAEPLEAKGIIIHHITLGASKAVIEKRLQRRGDGKAWNFHQVDRCLAGLSAPVFANTIDTDTNDLYGVVESIISRYGLPAVQIPQDRLSRWFRRTGVLLSHIRL